MGVSKITRNFQTTIPQDIRELKDLKQGDKVMFIVEDGDVKLVKKEEDVIERTKGSWDVDDGAEFERNVRKEWKDRRKREMDEEAD